MMLWAKIGVIAGACIVAGGLSMMKTGKIERQAEELGIQAQALIQKEQALEQRKQLLAEEQSEKLRLSQEYQKAMAALSEREKSARESQERANGLLAEIRRLEHENLELQAWARQHHPSAVISVYKSAASATSTGTDHSDQGGDQESSLESD